MRSNGVVHPPPPLDEYLRFQQRVEHFAVEQLVTKLAIEALDVAVLPRRTRFDEQRLHLDALKPFPHTSDRELWTVIAANVAGNAAADEQITQPLQYVLAG